MTNYKQVHNLLIAALALAGGASAQWTALSAPKQYYPTWSLASRGNALLATTNSGTYASADNAATWTPLSESVSGRQIVLTPNHTFVRDMTMIWRADAAGAGWVADTAGLELAGEIIGLYYDPTHDRLYAARSWHSYGFYYKSPSAASWTKVTTPGLGGTYATSVRGVVRAGSRVYVATGQAFYESTDGVAFTQKTGTGFPATDITAYSTSPLVALGDVLFYAAGGLYRSLDGGNAWTRVDQGFATFSVSGIPFGVQISAPFIDGGTIYAAVNATAEPDSVYASQDSGATWSHMSAGPLMSHVTAFVKHGGKLYAARSGKDSIMVWGGASSSVAGASRAQGGRFAVVPGIPSGRGLQVSWTGSPGPVTVGVHSPSGRTVARVRVEGTAGSRSIPMPNATPGLHFVTFEGNGFRETRSVVLP